MTLVCFDSNFVIWGVKQEATPGQEQNIAKVVHLLAWLGEQNRQILVPSIVVGEVLASLPPAAHSVFISLMETNFIWRRMTLRRRRNLRACGAIG